MKESNPSKQLKIEKLNLGEFFVAVRSAVRVKNSKRRIGEFDSAWKKLAAHIAANNPGE